MQRYPIRLGVVVVCLVLAASASGCNALGLGKNKDRQSDQPTFYDEFFSGQDEADAIASSKETDPAAPARMHRRNRLPGGLSSEAREIERGSFNIY
jgi:hypothetical protein